jgi:hypothetical protein
VVFLRFILIIVQNRACRYMLTGWEPNGPSVTLIVRRFLPRRYAIAFAHLWLISVRGMVVIGSSFGAFDRRLSCCLPLSIRFVWSYSHWQSTALIFGTG